MKPGSSSCAEKDGVWAVLFWLNLAPAATGKRVEEIVQAHWQRFGRHYYSRHDYEALDTGIANALMQGARACGFLAGQTLNGLMVAKADDFAYDDPVDGSVPRQQGIPGNFRQWRARGVSLVRHRYGGCYLACVSGMVRSRPSRSCRAGAGETGWPWWPLRVSLPVSANVPAAAARM